MFVTYPYFRLPFQFDAQSTNWHSVEVFLRHSWFMATIEEASEEVVRTFFISSPLDLLQIARSGAGGQLVGVSLVIAPRSFSDSHWRTVRIKQLGELVGSGDEPAELVLTDEEGLHYTGFPMAELAIPDRPVLRIAEFT